MSDVFKEVAEKVLFLVTKGRLEESDGKSILVTFLNSMHFHECGCIWQDLQDQPCPYPDEPFIVAAWSEAKVDVTDRED